MDPAIAYPLAIFVIGAYLVSVAIRYRREQAAKRAEQNALVAPEAPRHDDNRAVTPATGSRRTLPVSPPVDLRAPAVDPTPPARMAPRISGLAGPADSVFEVIGGIEWPNELTPLTTLAPRLGARDRVALISPAPPELVQAQLADALVASGTTVEWTSEERAAIQRDGKRAELQVFFSPTAARLSDREAFPTATATSTVVDVWVE